MTVAAPTLPLSERLASLPPLAAPPEIDPAQLEVDSLKVVARLRRHGHIVYLVGGCVRDLLAGAVPKDFDVATSAHPEDVRSVFRHSRIVGRRFRLAHVVFTEGRFVEVATFRSNPLPEPDVEGEEEGSGDLLVTDDNQFGTAEEDAKRRDFTINGLFYDVHEGRVIDFVGGKQDLARKVVRMIGDADVRLREDPIRAVRASRIAAKLDFTIDPELEVGMKRHASELSRCAPARILDELMKVLRCGASAAAFVILRRTGLVSVLLPSVERATRTPEALAAFNARLAALDTIVRRDGTVADAVLIANVLRPPPGLPESESSALADVLARMSTNARLPRKIADRVRAILQSQHILTSSAKRKRRKGGGAGIVRTPHFADALQLFEIEVLATGHGADLLEAWRERALESHFEAAPQEPVAEEGDAATVDEPSVDGVLPGVVPLVGSALNSDAGPKKRRRRRGGKRHRKPGDAAAGSEPLAAPAEDAGTP